MRNQFFFFKFFKNPLTPVCTITTYCSDTHPPELHPTEQLLIHTNIPHGSANVTIQSVSNKTFNLCSSVFPACVFSSPLLLFLQGLMAHAASHLACCLHIFHTALITPSQPVWVLLFVFPTVSMPAALRIE